ncbi:MAG: HEAT repeat domain-containing protein [Phycisphaerae bacterium]|nr:HEAT repeat domain-containing protein [Phycisphaerae bacterium]
MAQRSRLLGVPACILMGTSLAVPLMGLGGCDTISSDISSFTEAFNPPTPAEAATWAVDTSNPENQRRGIALLASAVWGGAEPYQKLYRLYIQEPTDPIVKGFAIRALGRHGDSSDAQLVAKELNSPYRLVRLESAKALQRLHDPAVADAMWKKLIDQVEDSEIRTELAIGLGQYPSDAVFQALVAAVDHRELAVNYAALDSLQTMTGQDFGMSQKAWLDWRASVGTNVAFRTDERFLYPTFQRDKGIFDYLMFWVPLEFESPGMPVGSQAIGARRTYSGENEPAEDFKLPVFEKPEKPADEAPAATVPGPPSGRPSGSAATPPASGSDRPR